MPFFVPEYRKRHFTSLFCLKKEKLEKWPFLDQNHGLAPLEKWQFFDFLNFFFYSLDRRFFVLEYRKRHFPGLFCPKKKKLEKWSFFDQNHGLTPLEKWQFFDFFNFFFYSLDRRFFRSRISTTKTFSWPILLHKKKMEKWPFLYIKNGLTPLE